MLENYAKAKILYEFGGTMMSPYFYMRSCPGKEILAPSSFRVTSYVKKVKIARVNYYCLEQIIS